MKPQFIKVPVDEAKSFRVTDEEVSYFYNPLHFHPELELTYVIKGKGTRFIGYHVESFFPGDLVLVGPNLPHCWKNDPEYYSKNSNLTAQAIVVQFKQDFAGSQLFELPELLSLKNLVTDARRGIKLYGKTREKIKGKLDCLLKQSGTARITNLLEILEIMALSVEKISLTEMDSNRSMAAIQMKRLNDVYQYTLHHFKEEISLKKISEVANMTPNAFCRFFRSHNRKTYVEFINEIRIANACKLLGNTNLPITQIAFDSGFNNLAHFNRVFKNHKKIVPFFYRKEHSKLEVKL